MAHQHFAKSHLAALAVCGTLALAACGPNYNAIDNRLRTQVMAQDHKIADLQEKLAIRDATVKQLQAEADAKLPRVETLPADRLAALFTAARVEIRPQTDVWQIGNSKEVNGFRVFFRTLTEDGQNIAAPGDVTIEAFELPPAPASPRRIGTWKFTAAEMKKNWYAGFGLNQFACNCPWKVAPDSGDITFRLSDRDGLTGRVLEAHLEKKVTLPKQGDKK